MLFPKESIQLLTRVLAKNGWIELPARGTSMYPFIKKGDICRFSVTTTESIKKGDVLLFRTLGGNLVAHRFCRMVTRNKQLYYLCKGDTNLKHDEAIGLDQLIGKLTWIERKRRIIHTTDLYAHVWGRIILTFPMIALLLRFYLNRKESFQV
ncbi:signal peptidase I [Paenibacillus sp. P36]|uniref:signal peptidase I n=1 Tax=Paenibacillus sp. P36 TaxID=3342538 RepID=UPI0038B25E4E